MVACRTVRFSFSEGRLEGLGIDGSCLGRVLCRSGRVSKQVAQDGPSHEQHEVRRQDLQPSLHLGEGSISISLKIEHLTSCFECRCASGIEGLSVICQLDCIVEALLSSQGDGKVGVDWGILRV